MTACQRRDDLRRVAGEQPVDGYLAARDDDYPMSTASAYEYNNKLNAKQEPDKQRVQIEHKHQH